MAWKQDGCIFVTHEEFRHLRDLEMRDSVDDGGRVEAWKRLHRFQGGRVIIGRPMTMFERMDAGYGLAETRWVAL